MTKREAGRLGGRATVARHGTEHMRAIGKHGFLGLARRLGYAGGSRHGALYRLIAKGRIRPFVPDLTEAEMADLYESVGL